MCGPCSFSAMKRSDLQSSAEGAGHEPLIIIPLMKFEILNVGNTLEPLIIILLTKFKVLIVGNTLG